MPNSTKPTTDEIVAIYIDAYNAAAPSKPTHTAEADRTARLTSEAAGVAAIVESKLAAVDSQLARLDARLAVVEAASNHAAAN